MCGRKVIYLQDGEVLEHAVLEALLGQLLELVNERDHVLAHGRVLEPEHVAAVALVRGSLDLDLLHDLVAERAHFGRTADIHGLSTLESTTNTICYISNLNFFQFKTLIMKKCPPIRTCW